MNEATKLPHESHATTLLTLGDLARACGVRLHAMKYALATYDVRPAQRAGIVRLFSAAQLPHIQSVLRRIAQRRGGDPTRAGDALLPIERGAARDDDTPRGSPTATNQQQGPDDQGRSLASQAQVG